MNWKRTLGWIAAIVVVLTVFAFVGGYVVLRSQRFHEFVLSKVVEKASQATGGAVAIQSYNFYPSKMTVDVYGIVVRGTEPANQAPLVAIDRLTLRLKVLSVLHQQVNLSELLIEHPVIHLLVNRDGQLNIPSPNAPKDTSSQTNIFDLAVGHVGLNNGEIVYDDAKLPLQADVSDLKTDIGFESLSKRYSGSLTYGSGRLQYGNYKPLTHALRAQFAMTPSEASLSSLELKVGSSQALVNAKVTNYSSPHMEGAYRLLLHPDDFAGALQNVSAKGDVTLAGSIRYQTSDQPFVKNVVLDGNVEARELALNTDEANLVLSVIRGRYQLANGNLALHPLTAALLGGQLLSSVNIQHLAGTPVAQVRAQLQRISVPALKRSVKSASLQNLPVTGVIGATATASWAGSVSTVKGNSDLHLRGAIQSQSKSSDVPLNADVYANYDGRSQRITLRQTSIHTRSTSIVAGGEISSRSNLVINARTSDLQEISHLASAFQAGKQPLDASGSATVDAAIHGSLQRPTIEAQIHGQDLRVEGSSWRSLQGNLHAGASQMSLQNASLISTRRGQVNANATVGLENWTYTSSSPITASVAIRQMPVADLQQLARQNYPVSGILSADLNLQGSQLNPIGHGTVQLVNAEAYNQPIQNLTLKFEGTGNAVHSTLAVATAAGAANGNLMYVPKTRTYQLKFSAPRIVLEQLQAVQAKNLAVNGFFAVSAEGAGSLDDPQLVASIQAPQVQFRESAITGIRADLSISNHLATLKMISDVANSSVKAHATMKLSGDYYTEANLDTTKIALDPLLAVYVSNLPTGAQAQIQMHASLRGPLKDKSRVEAHLEIGTLQASYQQLQIANAGPIRVDYANNLVTIQPSEIKGTETSLRIQGHVPIQTDKAMDLTAEGQVNMKLLKIFAPDVQSAGLINLNLHGTGNFNKPGVEGQIRLQNVAVTTTDAPLGVEKLNGTLDVANGQVRITQLQGQSGGGQISGSGTLNYEPQLQFNLALDAKKVRLLYPSGLRSVFDGNLALTGGREAASLNGQILIDSLSFTPEFDLASFTAQFSTPSLPPANPTFADHLKLNLGVQASSDLSAASSTVSIEGDVNLRVVGTAANPVIVGRTDLTSGDIFFAGKRYQLERGLINFTSPTHTEPYVNMLITTTIEQYNLNLMVTGPIEKLETKYTSDPPLPPVDIINLIARGQTTEESVPGNFSANQVLAQGLASQVSSRIGKLAGISSLTIDPNLGGNNQNPSARVAIQQRVTRNFIFTFSTDVTQPQSEIVQGEYQLNKRWSVTATRDQYGGFAFDGKYHTNF